MMIKEKSNPWARLKYAYVLPLAAVAVTAFARPEISNRMEEISAVKVNDLKEIVETKVLENRVVSELPAVAVKDTVIRGKAAKQEGTVFTVVERMPEYPGGVSACVNFIQENIKYPAEAVSKGIQGRVVVSCVINADGSLSDYRVVRSVNPALDAEAIRVLKMMPKWEPGMQKGKAVRVNYTLPVVFRLPEGKTGNNSGASLSAGDAQAPLILINGKEVSKEVMEALDPNKIESVCVLKGDDAKISKYGEKGKNGILSITLKPQTNSGIAVKSPVAGTIEVRGSVKDDFGKPLIGASVLLEGTTYGTISDADGNFVINTPEGGNLIVSYIGMQTAKVKAAPKVAVALESDK